MNKLSHFDENGNAYMVDISEKNKTSRKAIASGKIQVSKEIIDLIKSKDIKKGDVLNVATIAGIMAVKNTSSTIPMCHPLLISYAKIDFNINEEDLFIEALCTVKVDQATGVEMEAINGVSVALLTVYDMCKAVDKSMVIKDIRLEYKHGGKSGTYSR